MAVGSPRWQSDGHQALQPAAGRSADGPTPEALPNGDAALAGTVSLPAVRRATLVAVKPFQPPSTYSVNLPDHQFRRAMAGVRG